MICPTGCLAIFVSSPLSQNISLFGLVETGIEQTHPVPNRGAFCDRHGRRVRDAMDAAAHRRRRFPRTAKSCGPDAPTLVSSWRSCPRRRRWQTSPVTGYLMHTSLLRVWAATDSLVVVGLAEGGLMSMAIGLGRFGDRRLEKGGPRCMRPWFDGLVRAFDALRGTGRGRFGSRAFCAMTG